MEGAFFLISSIQVKEVHYCYPPQGAVLVVADKIRMEILFPDMIMHHMGAKYLGSLQRDLAMLAI